MNIQAPIEDQNSFIDDRNSYAHAAFAVARAHAVCSGQKNATSLRLESEQEQEPHAMQRAPAAAPVAAPAGLTGRLGEPHAQLLSQRFQTLASAGELQQTVRFSTEPYISTCVPSSTSRLPGSRKNAVAELALRARNANSRSRHKAMPGRSVATTVSRLTKNVVSIMSN
jgi:hypothetical protein